MSVVEKAILKLFQRYEVGPAEMLFVDFRECRLSATDFSMGMSRLIDKGLVVKERPSQAYSLTRAGYKISR